jgi:hypothetical protein
VHQYHTVVRVCLDDGNPPQTVPPQSAPSNRPDKDHTCTIEYAPYMRERESSLHNISALHSSQEGCFSVTWSSSLITGASYCLVPVKFCNMGMPGNFTLKLFVGTERIRVIDTNVSCAEQYQESFALIRLFSEGDAQAACTAKVTEVDEMISELGSAIAKANHDIDECKLKCKPGKTLTPHRQNDARSAQKRKALTDTKTLSSLVKERDGLALKLSAARTRLASVRPVQVFRPVISAQGGQPSFHMPSQQVRYSTPANRLKTQSKNGKKAIQRSTATSDLLIVSQTFFPMTASSTKITTTTTESKRRSSPSKYSVTKASFHANY